MAQSDILLEVESLAVNYGQIEALKDASLTINRGEVVVLLGANGAGKTTLIQTVLGINTPRRGAIRYKGKSIVGRAADRNVRDGIALVPEGPGVFASMSVVDNLLLGAHHDLGSAKERLSRVFEWFPVLGSRREQVAKTLSGGERRMLAIGRALMSRPELILIDEPSIGLAPKVVNDIFKIIADLHKEGYSILLSEQNVYKALKTSDRAYVLETGRTVLTGNSADLMKDPAIKEAYLGA